MDGYVVPASGTDAGADRRAVWVVFGLIGLFVTATRSDAVTLWGQWMSSFVYSHGPLIALLVLWLIWRDRATLAFDRSAPVAAALGGLLALEGLWAFAYGARVDIARQLLAPMLIWLAVVAALGVRSAWRVAFPLALVWTAISIWDVLVWPLQFLTAAANAGMLNAVGIPTVREGFFLTIPAGTFEIAPGCSGLSFLVVAVTVAALYGHVQRLGIRSRAVLVVAALPFALVSNWLRVFFVVVQGERTNMQTELVTKGHLLFGWILFAGFLAIFLALAGRFGGAGRPEPAPGDGPRATRPVAARRALVAALALVAGPAVGSLADLRMAHAGWQPLPLPAGRGTWMGPTVSDEGWHPAFSSPSTEFRSRYDGAAGSVYVDLAFYAVERGSAKLVGFYSHPDGPEGTEVTSSVVRVTGLGSGSPATVRDLVVRSGAGEAWRVWRWYQIGQVAAADEIGAKVAEGMRVFGGNSGSAAVSLAVACHNGCAGEREEQLLAAFLADMAAPLVASATGRETTK